RGIPALLYRQMLGNRRTVAAGLLQATSLSFIVAAVQIGTLLGEISAATGAALIGAGLLSVILFPLLALMLLGGSGAKRNGHEQLLGSMPPLLTTQERPGPKQTNQGIPSQEWPQGVHRVLEHHESLRQVAADY